MAKNAKAAPVLIPAVVYLRKSTKGIVKSANGTERIRQEKSITQQKTEIEKLLAGKYRKVGEYSDEGVSGWKRGGKRPGFDKMLREIEANRNVDTIICDDLDRFSRAEVMDVFADLSRLSAAGVKTIHCVNQGKYGLGENDIGRIIKMVVDIHGGNDFSRKLSRRVTLAHRNRAAEGKRAGNAPYGFENDGKGGLKHGDRKHLAVIKRIYKRFVELKHSYRQIALDLNNENIPSSRGTDWSVQAVKELIARPVYCGDFAYGRRQEGKFFTTGKDGEVVESFAEQQRWTPGEAAFTFKNVFTPVVTRKVWDAAQQRAASFKMMGDRVARRDGHALSGILICDNCGKRMYGCSPKNRNHSYYRCGSGAKTPGAQPCQSWQIAEDKILPFVLKLLAEEIDDVRKLLIAPPEQLVLPDRFRSVLGKEAADDRQDERKALVKKIELAERNAALIDDVETVLALSRQIKTMRAELVALDEQLDSQSVSTDDYNAEELEALVAWWDEFKSTAVNVPVPLKKLKGVTHEQFEWASDGVIDREAGDSKLLMANTRIVNEALHALGAEVRLRFKTKQVTLSTGRVEPRHDIVGGQFRLGQATGKIAGKNGVLFLKAPVAGRSSGIRAAGRCGSRKGRG